jgi:RimJ/RimL family protein N-acetyltransferase
MTAASRARAVRLRSGHAVWSRPVRPADAPVLARAYARLGERSRYRRFFTIVPELSPATLRGAVEVDHTDHEALVAMPLLSAEIVAECRFIRLDGQPDTADVAVTVADAWQGRGLGAALLQQLSQRALEVGIRHFTAEILAENRAMLALLRALGRVETESHGTVVTARVDLAGQPRPRRQELPDLLIATARVMIVDVPGPVLRLTRIPDEVADAARRPATVALTALVPRPPAPAQTRQVSSGSAPAGSRRRGRSRP